MASSRKCAHKSLLTKPSPYAEIVGYKPFTPQQLFTAATGSRKRIKISDGDQDASYTFPAPLVLPGDELAQDPKCPPQNLKSWLNAKDRNEVTQDRKTVYIAAAPKAASSMKPTMKEWDMPRSDAVKDARLIDKSCTTEVLAYLQAFFHGLSVTLLPGRLEFSEWKTGQKSKSKSKSQNIHFIPEHIGLRSVELNLTTRIRVRHLGESDDFSPYAHQLNLNDMLDHAIAVLPTDAYCLMLLTDHDLYEDNDDDFCCGRSYGESRIAVVSNAQYQPALDSWHSVNVTDGHWWPGSHCEDFVQQKCDEVQKKGSHSLKKSKKDCKRSKGTSAEVFPSGRRTLSEVVMVGTSIVVAGSRPSTPFEAAMASHIENLSKASLSEDDLRSLYLRRVTLTASHELLHCLGLDHCVYSACAMQGTASMIEDSRQPPFLCQACENKLASAVANQDHPTGSNEVKGNSDQDWWESPDILGWKRARHEQVLRFSEERGSSDLGFGPLGTWTRRYLDLAG